MDFSAFNSRRGAEAGAEMTIRHPVTGEPILHGDKPCVVIVRGTESPSAQAALAAVRKRRMGEEKGKGKSDDGQSMADLHASLVDAAVPLIMGFRHVSLSGRELTADDAQEFLDLNMVTLELDDEGQPKALSFAEQVLRFAGTRANFLPQPATGQASGSDSSAGSTRNAKR